MGTECKFLPNTTEQKAIIKHLKKRGEKMTPHQWNSGLGKKQLPVSERIIEDYHKNKGLPTR